MADLIERLVEAMKVLGKTTPTPATKEAHACLGKAIYEIERLRVEKIEAAREGWFRAVVFYLDIDAESDPAVIAEVDRRWPLDSHSATAKDDA